MHPVTIGLICVTIAAGCGLVVAGVLSVLLRNTKEDYVLKIIARFGAVCGWVFFFSALFLFAIFMELSFPGSMH